MRTLLKRWWWPSVTAPPDSCRDFHLLRTINTQTCVSAVFLGALIKIRHSELPPSITYNYTFVSVEQQWTKKKKTSHDTRNTVLRAALPLPGVTTKRVRPPGAHGRTDPGGDDDLGLHCPQTPDGCVVRSLLNSYSVLKKKKRRRRKEKGKKEKARWPARLPAAPKQHSTNCRRTKYHQSFMGIKLNKTKRLLQIY